MLARKLAPAPRPLAFCEGLLFFLLALQPTFMPRAVGLHRGALSLEPALMVA